MTDDEIIALARDMGQIDMHEGNTIRFVRAALAKERKLLAYELADAGFFDAGRYLDKDSK